MKERPPDERSAFVAVELEGLSRTLPYSSIFQLLEVHIVDPGEVSEAVKEWPVQVLVLVNRLPLLIGMDAHDHDVYIIVIQVHVRIRVVDDVVLHVPEVRGAS